MATLDGVTKLQNIIGYKFQNRELIKTAISHPGLKKGNKIFGKNFERLEFLGDRVLGLSLSSFLYEKFPTDSSGNLALRLATLAGTDFLINLAKKTKIIDCFSIPKDFFISLNKNSSSIADMLEAVLGSVFLDSDFSTARKVVLKLWKNDIKNAAHKKKDSKSYLQEITQLVSGELPVYRLVKMTGKAHDPIFEMEVSARGISIIGYGNTKKNAELDAANRLIKKLKGMN
jgi:ribonuclease-3